MRDELLFDASSIINLCGRGMVNILVKGYTLDLALYEIGNAVWKHIYVFRKVSLEDSLTVLDALVMVLGKMRCFKVESPLEVLKLAVEEGLTFYDASYLYTALKNGMILITDDAGLRKVARKYVKVFSSREL